MVDWLLILYWVIQAQQKRQNAFKWTLARYNQRSTCTNITCIWIYVVAQPKEHNQNMQTDDIKMQRKINTSRTCNSNNANENHIMLFQHCHRRRRRHHQQFFFAVLNFANEQCTRVSFWRCAERTGTKLKNSVLVRRPRELVCRNSDMRTLTLWCIRKKKIIYTYLRILYKTWPLLPCSVHMTGLQSTFNLNRPFNLVHKPLVWFWSDEMRLR